MDGSFSMMFLGHNISLGYRNHTNILMRYSFLNPPKVFIFTIEFCSSQNCSYRLLVKAIYVQFFFWGSLVWLRMLRKSRSIVLDFLVCIYCSGDFRPSLFVLLFYSVINSLQH